MTTLLGIDVGTTAVKIVAVDGDNGRVLTATERTYSTAHPRDGWVEQDPDDWLNALADGLDEVTAAVDHPAAIGICSQVNTHVAVDADLRPLAPAISWQDQRCAAVAAELDALVDDRRAAIWGGPFTIDASCPIARAEWWRRHEPDVWERTRWLLSPKDVCVAALTGDVATDRISPIGLVGTEGEYLDAALDLVPGLAATCPPLAEFDAVVGTTNGALGVAAGVPVAVGTMDVWGSLFGSGVVDPGDAAHISGTSEVAITCADRSGGAAGVISFPAVRGRYVHAAPTQAGGDALRWVSTLVGLPIDGALAAAAAARRRPQPIVFLPYLAGERAPLWNPAARGVFVGLTSQSEAGDVVLAVLEGVAHAARRNLRQCEVVAGGPSTRVRLAGGATRSDLWNQIKADAHGRPLEVVESPAVGAVGAALMGAVAAGIDDDLDALARRLARVRAVVEPDPAATTRLDDLHDVFVTATDQLLDTFATLADIGQSGETMEQ